MRCEGAKSEQRGHAHLWYDDRIGAIQPSPCAGSPGVRSWAVVSSAGMSYCIRVSVCLNEGCRPLQTRHSIIIICQWLPVRRHSGSVTSRWLVLVHVLVEHCALRRPLTVLTCRRRISVHVQHWNGLVTCGIDGEASRQRRRTRRIRGEAATTRSQLRQMCVQVYTTYVHKQK